MGNNINKDEIKFIYFDVGDVLLHLKKTSSEYISEYLNIDISLYRKVIDNIRKDNRYLWQYRNIKEEEEFFRKIYTLFLKKLGLTYNEEDLNQIIRYELKRDYIANKEDINIIKKLSAKYRLGVLSNAGSSRREHELKIYDLYKYFEVIILSKEVGSRKPNPDIYQYAIEKSSEKPEHILYIDDKEINLEGARKEGIDNLILFSKNKVKSNYIQIQKISDILNILDYTP